MSGPRLVVFCWLVAIALLTYHWLREAETAPPASAFLGSATMYSIAAVVAAIPATATLGGALAIAWTVSLAYRSIGAGTFFSQAQGAKGAKAA